MRTSKVTGMSLFKLGFSMKMFRGGQAGSWFKHTPQFKSLRIFHFYLTRERKAFQICWKCLVNLNNWSFQGTLLQVINMLFIIANKAQVRLPLDLRFLLWPADLHPLACVDTYYSFVSVSRFMWYRMMSWVRRVSLRWRCMVLIVRVVWWLLHTWIRWLQESYRKFVEAKECTQGVQHSDGKHST